MRHVTVRLKKDELNLYTLNDVQVGGMGVDIEAFTEYVEEAAHDPIGRVLGLGDYTDGLSPSNRATIKAAQAGGRWYDVGDNMLRAAAQLQVDEFEEAVRSLQVFGSGRGKNDKVDGFLKGHHFYEYKRMLRGSSYEVRSTDMDIADFLGTPYLDDTSDKKQMTMFTYRFPKGKVLRVLAMHGEGSSATEAAALNRLNKIRASFQADIYITAHHHKLFVTKMDLLREDPRAHTKLRAQEALMVAAGSWMRGYVEDEATYAEAGSMAPLAIGAPIIQVVSTDKGFKLKGII